MHNDRISTWARWGRSRDALRLDERPALVAFLAEQLGGLGEVVEPVPLESLDLLPSRLSVPARQALADALGAERVSDAAADRAVHSVGKSYRDMLAARRGVLTHVTDAVLYPRHEQDVVGVLAAARKHDLAVIPFGGGTSVVRGVEPRRGSHQAVVTLDMKDMNEIRLDPASNLADIGAGAFGPEIERALAAKGFTLGHFPQSFEFSTFGGWLATRSAGQASTRYGKIEDIVRAVRLATPAGLVVTRRVPASASGPSVLQHVIGSEGVFGVITSGTARVRPIPETIGYWGCLLPEWSRAIAFVRDLVQSGVVPAVVRLSNADETRWLMKTSSQKKGLVQRLGKAYIQRAVRRRSVSPDRVCLCILSFEGSRDAVRLALRCAKEHGRRRRAVGLGSAPGRSWERERFALPYLRDELMARGVMVDTLETATTWGNVERLDGAVREAIDAGIEAGGTRGAVMVHISHVYETGSALYFTFIARQQAGNELAQWQTIKTAATRAILDHGGTLSHHHGIGYEHRPLEAEHGPVAVEALRAFKASVDPTGVMNPEKLL